jgi:hypothetical protein
VVSLALIHFPEDPGRPWWSACAVLAISLAAGLAALELRRAENVYASGLLLNVAGMLLWWTWQPTDTKWLPSLLETNILCLSLSAVIWSLTERLCPGAVPHPAMEPPVNWREDAPPRLPFPHTAVMACTGLAVALALLGLFNGLNARPHLAALGALAVAILLPVDATPDQRGARQHAVILLAVLLLNAAGWALLPADIAAGPLHRSVVLMIASAAVTVLAFVGQALPDSRKAGDATSGDLILVRHSLTYGNDWLARARQALPGLAGLTAVMIAAVLIQEAFRFHTGLDVPLAPWEIAAVAGSMLTIAAACIAFAVVAEWDPFRQNDRQRQIYVYLAEAVLLLIGFHVRFTMPWIFRGYFQQYWMFLVMAVSFLGAGLSEWFYRRRLPVLAQPLERTCLLVPLIPAVGYWFMPEAEYLWWLVGQTPLLWFFMGLFYSVISATRRSVLSAVLAVLAMNMGLWVTLHAHDIRFLYHPQLWLIPLALAALVAGHLGRDRLTEAQRAAIHYSTLSVIYISSTFDMYIDWTLHLGWHWQLPLVLMVLSVAGTMAGILLRVRSFLYLGVTFLIVDLLSMICHAAIDYPWIWYASGVVLGAAIIAVFALFEKRRNDVLAAVEKLREWKG